MFFGRVERIFEHDAESLAAYDALCQQAGIRRDAGLEVMVGLRDEEGHLLAAGGRLGNTLRSLVVAESCRGEGLLPLLVGHMMDEAALEGYFRLFIYGKSEYEPLFASLGFYPIARAEGRLVFMENRQGRFAAWLDRLEEESRHRIRAMAWEKREVEAQQTGAAGLVMHLNPMTLGHEALIRKALAENPLVHLFILEEESSGFSAADRRRFAERVLDDAPGLILHGTDDYLISRASFPSYFLRKLDEAALLQAEIDARIFLQVGRKLHIRRRYLGSEPFNPLGEAYNQLHAELLRREGMDVTLMERVRDEDGIPYSASRVRELLDAGAIEKAQRLVPPALRELLAQTRRAP